MSQKKTKVTACLCTSWRPGGQALCKEKTLFASWREGIIIWSNVIQSKGIHDCTHELEDQEIRRPGMQRVHYVFIIIWSSVTKYGSIQPVHSCAASQMAKRSKTVWSNVTTTESNHVSLQELETRRPGLMQRESVLCFTSATSTVIELKSGCESLRSPGLTVLCTATWDVSIHLVSLPSEQ